MAGGSGAAPGDRCSPMGVAGGVSRWGADDGGPARSKRAANREQAQSASGGGAVATAPGETRGRGSRAEGCGGSAAEPGAGASGASPGAFELVLRAVNVARGEPRAGGVRRLRRAVA